MARSTDRTTPHHDFPVVRHGYDPRHVQQHLQRLQDDVVRSAAERDEARAAHAELTGRLDAARQEIAGLTARLVEMSTPAEGPETTEEQANRALALATAQAGEITQRAQAAAGVAWTGAEQASLALRDRYRTVLADLDRQHAKAQAEYQALMDEARAHAEQMTGAAQRRQAESDVLAERERTRIEREFQASVSTRRAELDRELEAGRAAAQEQARRTVAAAQQEAQRLLAEAEAEVQRLAGVREQLTKRLRATSELLGRSSDLLQPSETEVAANRAD